MPPTCGGEADDAGIDERGLRRGDDLLDPKHGVDIDGVAIDHDRLLRAPDDERRQPLGQGNGLARRHDREDDVGLRYRIVFGADHAGIRSALQRRLAPPLQGRQHPCAMLAEASGDGAAHGAGREDRNGL